MNVHEKSSVDRGKGKGKGKQTQHMLFVQTQKIYFPGWWLHSELSLTRKRFPPLGIRSKTALFKKWKKPMPFVCACNTKSMACFALYRLVALHQAWTYCAMPKKKKIRSRIASHRVSTALLCVSPLHRAGQARPIGPPSKIFR